MVLVMRGLPSTTRVKYCILSHYCCQVDWCKSQLGQLKLIAMFGIILQNWEQCYYFTYFMASAPTKLSDAILCITSLQDSLDWVFLFASVIVRFSFFDIIPYIYTIQPPLYWPSSLSVSLDHSIQCYVWHSLCLHSHNVAIITEAFLGNSFNYVFFQIQ